jgi:pre-mRNA-processing factor 40
MLAENTEIDARTRWRDAIELLQDDSRFKNVEDAHDREDLFNDFVLELEKKEREDRTKQRDAALQKVGTILETLATDGTITRKSSWVDSRKEVLDRLSGSEFRSLEDVDVKRTFQDYVGRLDAQYKDEEKRRKEYLQRKVDKLATAFKEAVEQLLFVGVVRSNSRWKDSVLKEEVSQSKDYTALVEALETPLSGDFLPSVPGLGSLPSTAAALGITITARDVFEKAVTAAREAYRSDKRLVKDVLEDSAFGFTYQTTPAQFKMAIFSAAGLRTQAERDGTLLAGDPGAVSRAVHQLLTEDGEEIEDGYMEAGASRSKILAAKQLRSMLMKRPAALDQVFSDMQEEAQAEREEALRRQRKKEERYVELLEEYFYRSDHVGVGWEEAKHLLERHSAYAALAKPDRSRVFAEYMEQLARKMEAKTKSMRTLLSSAATSSNGEKADAEENVGVSESSAGNNAREASASVSAPAPMEAGGAAMGPVAAPPAGVGVGGSDDPSGPPAIESSALAKEKKRSRTDRHSDADRGALENENDVDDDEEEEEEEGDDDTKDKKSKKHKKDKRSKKVCIFFLTC